MNIQSTRVWLSVIIAMVVVIFMVWVVPAHPYEPRGVLLPAKIVRKSSSPDKIRMYARVKPLGAQTLGTIHIELHYPDKTTSPEKPITQFAKQLAARVGANGIVVKSFQAYGGGNTGLAIYNFVGEAIYTSNMAIHGQSDSPYYGV